jgi:uncharacterized membrane protein
LQLYPDQGSSSDIIGKVKKIAALKTIVGVSIFGMLFSGYLSYQELFKDTTEEIGCNPIGTPGTIFGFPPCIYGFFMYLLVLIIAALGIRGRRGE